jgi:hypothetical protein
MKEKNEKKAYQRKERCTAEEQLQRQWQPPKVHVSISVPGLQQKRGATDDDGVLHSIVLLEGLDELGNGGSLLTDSNVDTVKLLGLIIAVVPALLVQDGVKSDSSLSGLTVTWNVC